MTIHDLKPSAVWKNFYGLTTCPRPSKHEEIVRDYLLKWANERNIEAFTDETGNVIMRVPATKGCENMKAVIMQGHMDMVPQKNSDTVHDFLTDPIQTYVDGDWLRAKGTTLGADDGLGVAMGMTVLEDKSLKHGPLELLVTYDEETGMTGARNLTAGILKGEILINLDTETEGELCIGCAGGLNLAATGTYASVEAPEGYKSFVLSVKGCRGGHSGLEISEGRANSIKVAMRIVNSLLSKGYAEVVDIEGGTLRNAIPRECFVNLLVRESRLASARNSIRRAVAELKNEFAQTDPLMDIKLTATKSFSKYIQTTDAKRFVRAVLSCPSGVERMSASVPGLVETSINLAIVKAKNGKFNVTCLCRSSIDSAKFALGKVFESIFTLAGLKVKFSGAYSGWAPNPNSEILHLMESKYKQMFGKPANVIAVHAGLECGIMAGKYPHWDMVSMGPTLLSPHSPDERAYIPSVQTVWDFLIQILAEIPEK